MKTSSGHLTYCTNIHSGEHWADHFAELKRVVPAVIEQLGLPADHVPFGLGLRLSNVASEELAIPEVLAEFQTWLKATRCYVFTMNGFPYGGFHGVRVKDQVHAPDWTTEARVAYTVRLFRILAQLLPDSTLDESTPGGISTSPLSYRRWFDWEQPASRDYIFSQTTQNILEVVKELVRIRQETGQLMHLDLEPEPDGLLETTDEFISWFIDYLLPLGIEDLSNTFGMTDEDAEEAICDHVQLCYDVCHFAVGYERPADVLAKLRRYNLNVGKLQISAALKAEFPADDAGREAVKEAFARFDEPTYLHQVVARTTSNQLLRFADMPDAQAAFATNQAEWRAHFHVPIFVADYGLLQSTRDDIDELLRLQQEQPFTSHLEVETYTWEVLPDGLKRDLAESIGRELSYVARQLTPSTDKDFVPVSG